MKKEIKMVEVKFLRDSYSPEFGEVEKNEKIPMEENQAKVLEDRGEVEIVNPKKKDKK